MFWILSDERDKVNLKRATRNRVRIYRLPIMETGVQAFGTRLGVTFADRKNWQNILEESDKAIKKLLPKDPLTIKLSAASANLYSVKLAWRNEVMHPNDTYTLARDLGWRKDTRHFPIREWDPFSPESCQRRFFSSVLPERKPCYFAGKLDHV
jgi:hypothetical protein